MGYNEPPYEPPHDLQYYIDPRAQDNNHSNRENNYNNNSNNGNNYNDNNNYNRNGNDDDDDNGNGNNDNDNDNGSVRRDSLVSWDGTYGGAYPQSLKQQTFAQVQPLHSHSPFNGCLSPSLSHTLKLSPPSSMLAIV